MLIKIITAGKPSNEFFEIFEKYQKRINSFAKFEHASVKPQNLFNTLLKTKKDFHLVLLDENGKLYNSLEFAKHLEQTALIKSNICFAVGPAEGFKDEEKSIADELLSLTSMTLQHDIATLVLYEQIYRALTILPSHPYHK